MGFIFNGTVEPNDGQMRSILGYLLFNKALISDGEKNENIDGYLTLLQENEKNVSAITDPFNRSIHIAFELVESHGLNPWDIDLTVFSRLYLERVERENIIDLATAGRIVLMAWKILRKQSEDIVRNATPPAEEEPYIQTGDWYLDDEQYDYTQRVIGGLIPIEEKIRRKGARKVTLLELIDLLRSAKQEADTRKKIQEQIQRMKEEWIEQDLNLGENIHSEDVEEDVDVVWKRICQFDGQAIPFTNICEATKESIIKTFVSILFLADRKKIQIWQEDFPYGEIFIKNLEAHKEFSEKEPFEPG